MRLPVLSLIGLFLLESCTDKSERIKPFIGSITSSVYASVTVQPANYYDVFSPKPGIIHKVFVKEGDTVHSGQILAEIAMDNSKINLESAQLNVELTRENYIGKSNVLLNITNEISSVKDQLAIDSLNYVRQKKLWEKNIGSKVEFENRKLQYELSLNKLDLLNKKLAQTKIELENSFKQSQTALKKAESDLTDNLIKANINGKVYCLFKQEGEMLNQQEPFAQIGKSNLFIVEMLIDEVDITKIAVGQTTFVTLDSYPGEVFEAMVSKIYPQKDSRTQTFQVDALFEEVPPTLYAGLSGEANILLSQKNDVITIPIAYLMDGNKVKTKNGVVEVKLGMKNIERAEVVSGIDTSTYILKP